MTVDAVQTTRAHARYLHQRGAYYVFTVKENNVRLDGQLDSLPWQEISAFATEETGHGRTERRTTRLAPLGDFHSWPTIDFPHATHAYLIERHTTINATGKARADAALGIINLTGEHAHPASVQTLRVIHAEAKKCRATSSAANGKLKIACTGSATSPTPKTTAEPAPATLPEPWPPFATSPSAPYAWPDTPTSPKHYATPPATSPDHSSFTESSPDKPKGLCRDPA
ncbi:hypothetical protein [Saccharopolyspora hattusasensis]|uniref:hypothetical protein n=1 Tax=Saccharopolyspora hattusasensis TaxID=1128679 RepID=UPI003D95B701